MADATRESGGRLARALVVLAATVAFAALVWPSFRPPAGVGGDITQDWLSAREYRAGNPVYGDMRDATRRHMNGEHAEGALRWNAHPPASVLFTLPLAYLSHEDAYFAWNLITFPLFVIAVWITSAGVGLRPWNAAGVTAAITLAGVTCFPLREQVSWAQISAPLAFLIAVAWWADRRGLWALAGVAVGVAASVKLFPAFILLYFGASGRWRTVVVAVATGLAINVVAVAVLGINAYQTYIREVVPALSVKYGASWPNISLSAFWLRLFDTTFSSGVSVLALAPALGWLLAVLARIAVSVTVGLLALRCGTAERRDRAFAAAVIGMILVSPISWSHSLVMLVVPIGVLLRASQGRWLWVLLLMLAVLWLPNTFVPGLLFGREFDAAIATTTRRPLTLAENLLGTSVPHYALLGLFLLTLRAGSVSDGCPRPSLTLPARNSGSSGT